jgi:N-acetylneuraminic acid mutarotase
MYHSAGVLNGLVYIVGAGREGNDAFCFDPTVDAWSTLAPTMIDRQQGSCFVLGANLYVVGGRGNDSSAKRYDVATDTWVMVADMLEGRRSFAAVTIGSTGQAEEQDLFDSLITKASRGQADCI